MDVRNCKNCGRMFNYIVGEKLCQQCKSEMEEKFQEVKAYIYDHKHADIREVSEECNVPISQIKHWIREDRIQFSEDSLVGIPCEKCGEMIKSGRFCKKCSNELISGFNSDKQPSVKKDNTSNKNTDHKNKMRYL